MEYDEYLFLIKFGNHLWFLQLSKNLSQEMLSNNANIPINQMVRIVRAEISTYFKTLYKIA